MLWRDLPQRVLGSGCQPWSRTPPRRQLGDFGWSLPVCGANEEEANPRRWLFDLTRAETDSQTRGLAAALPPLPRLINSLWTEAPASPSFPSIALTMAHCLKPRWDTRPQNCCLLRALQPAHHAPVAQAWRTIVTPISVADAPLQRRPRTCSLRSYPQWHKPGRLEGTMR